LTPAGGGVTQAADTLAHGQAYAYAAGAVAVVAYLALGSLLVKPSKGLLAASIGEDGRYSTSKFQFFVWTAVVVFAYVALFTVHWFRCGATCPAPSWQMASNVLLAMGFSVVTMATAKGVTSAYVYSGRVVKTPAMRPARLSDLVAGDDFGIPDLAKVQMLIWTAIAVVSYLFTVNGAILAATDPTDFPNIDSTLMVLMGIGQGAYLGAKIVSSAGASISKLTPDSGQIGIAVQIAGQGFGSQGVIQFGDSRVAPATWSDTSCSFTVPAAGAGGQPPVTGSTVYVAVLPTDAMGNVLQATGTLQFKVT
jgi:hypothetical protein